MIMLQIMVSTNVPLLCINADHISAHEINPVFKPSFLVYKWNHDPTYNQELSQDDSIEHVYVEKFEKFEDDQYLQEFLDTHGRMFLSMLVVHQHFGLLCNSFLLLLLLLLLL
jgi:hypothetical protein